MALTSKYLRSRLRKTGSALLTLAVLGLFMSASPAQDDEKKEAPAKFARVLEIPSEVVSESTSGSAYKTYGLLQGDVDVIQGINKRIEQGWRDNTVTPSRPATDFEFARRAYLDIIGRIPTPEEIEAYLGQKKPVRRVWLVNQLLESKEYARHWGNLWANWSLGRTGAFGAGMYKDQLQEWFQTEFQSNTRWDEVVKKLLTASGKNTDPGNGAVNFMLAHVGEPTPQDKRRSEGQFQMVPLTSRITRLFLGIQTQCTQCHDHPFDANLRQEHFWGVNAFLRQIEREGTLPANNNAAGPLTLKINTNANPTSVVRYEKRNGVLLETTAKFLGKRLARDMRREDRRPELAKFILEHKNFSKAIVNRMWGTFMGKGFVQPLDDFNEINTPSHPDLLSDLGASYQNYNYDQKRLIRWIVLSDAYNLSAVANKTNEKPEHERFFSRMMLKAMSPEQLFESMMVASKKKKPGENTGEARARWLTQLVANFGDDEGNEITFNGTIVQALLMMNGDEINKAITEGKGAVKYALDTYPGSGLKRVNYLYLSTLSRPVTQPEYAKIVAAMKLRTKQTSIDAMFHDLFWGLLNSNEFILNH